MAVLAHQNAAEAQLDRRVAFEHGYPCRIMSVDGSWCCNALLEDISEEGAKLTVFGSPEDGDIKEFFLVLTRRGSAHRRCARLWLNGQQMGVQFVSAKTSRARQRRRSSER
jgi:hypothetical protein